jgi:hypothetical protein
MPKNFKTKSIDSVSDPAKPKPRDMAELEKLLQETTKNLPKRGIKLVSRDNVYAALTDWARSLKLISDTEYVHYLTVADTKKDGPYNLHICEDI